VKVDLQQVEDAAKELYIRALKLLPPDIKQGFDKLVAGESDHGAKRVLGTMLVNIKVAEDTQTLLCQDTGIPIYNVRIGRGVEVDGFGRRASIRSAHRSCIRRRASTTRPRPGAACRSSTLSSRTRKIPWRSK